MMTGDNRLTAEAVSRKVGGIDEIHSDVAPEQKETLVETLKDEGRRVAMAATASYGRGV